MKKHKIKNIIYIVVIILVTMIILSRLFLNIRYRGHDTVFHMTNIIRLSENISLKNIFGPDIITYNFNMYGYGLWLFYPKLPHLIAAYIQLITNDVYLSMGIVYLITTILSGIFTYFLSKKITKNKEIALLSSIIYVTVPYHVCEIYIRDAFSENFMFMVLPMIFLGLYNLKDNNYKKFYILFILGYIIGMNSHLVSMVFYTFFVGLFILYYRKDFLKKDKIKSLIISTIIVTIMTLPYLVNLISHKSLNIYRVYTDAFVTLENLKHSVINLSSLYNQQPIYDNLILYFNVITIVLFILTTINFFITKKTKHKKDKKIFLIFIVILINFLCSKAIWDYMPDLLLSIQFPWRLLVLLSLVIALYSPLILDNLKMSPKLKKIVPLLFIPFVLIDGMNNVSYHDVIEVKIDTALNSPAAMGYQKEYLPDTEEVDGKYVLKYQKRYFQLRENGVFTDNDTKVKIIKEDFPNLEFEVNNLTENTTIELPRIYYLGYKLTDDDNKQIQLSMNEKGFLEAKIDENGIYNLKYTKTKIRRITEIIRIIMIIVIPLILIIKRSKNNEKNT